MSMNALETARDETRETVASNLDAELTRQRWSKRKAAAALGITPIYVTRRTSGEVELSASDLVMFASFLNIPVTRLLTKLPDLDSNQEPAGFTPAPIIRLSDRRPAPHEVHTSAGAAIVSTFPLSVGA
jgi:transcriptional regulator with XRE-family HTH domain